MEATGILETLTEENAEILAFMLQVRSTFPSPEGAKRLYPRIRRRLIVHLEAEERVLYGACTENSLTNQHIPELRAQHNDIEELIVELDTLSMDARTWRAAFTVLHERVRNHMRTEELELFPACEAVFSASELEDLRSAYSEAQKDLEDRIVIGATHNPAPMP